ncbi:hypothetical protein G7046_g3258 [Stylonectria norvegica]|nr:hypothetical protein G7046_g3258 [Stylonectria norvegica]
MSSLINKVKEALSSDNKTTTPEGTTAGHNTTATGHNTTGQNTTTPHTTQDTQHIGTHQGTHQGTYSSTGNYDADNTRGVGSTGPATTTAGPHKSNVLNKADPRVDSDRDGSKNLGSNTQGTTTGSGNYLSNTSGTGQQSGIGGIGGQHSTSTGTGHHNTTAPGSGGAFFNGGDNNNTTRDATSGGYTGGLGGNNNTSSHTGALGGNNNSGLPEGSTGPHNSRIANAADPRVDSDRDGSKNIGGQHQNTSAYGNTGLTGTGHHTGDSHNTAAFGNTGLSRDNHGTHGSHNTSGAPEGTYGTHNSRIANAADPRIDSDRDGSKNIGGHSNTTGTHGTTGGLTGTGTHGSHNTSGAPEGTYGAHNSRVANAADPRIDSDRDETSPDGTHPRLLPIPPSCNGRPARHRPTLGRRRHGESPVRHPSPAGTSPSLPLGHSSRYDGVAPEYVTYHSIFTYVLDERHIRGLLRRCKCPAPRPKGHAKDEDQHVLEYKAFT